VNVFCHEEEHNLHNDKGPAYVKFGKVRYDDNIHNDKLIPEKDFLIKMIDAKGARYDKRTRDTTDEN